MKNTAPSLAGTDFLGRPATRRVMQALNADGVVTRVVGGAVRNALMQRPVRDIDLATTGTPDEVTAIAKEAGLHVVATGVAHGTVTVIADSKPFEVTTLRRDVETDGRRATVAFDADWYEDARRRDFTINALYASAEGEVFDPLGGYADLSARSIRFIGEADARIHEDYLRILRYFRFAAEMPGFELDGEGSSACARNVGGLRRLSPERVRAELVRLLMAPGAMKAVQSMFDYGVLVEVLAQAPLPNQLSRMIALEEKVGARPDPMLRLAALALHAQEDAGRFARRFRLSNAERYALKDAAAYPRANSVQNERDGRRLLYRVGLDAWRRIILLDWARSGEPLDDAERLALATLPFRWKAPETPVAGHDLIAMGMSPGPQLGAVLLQIIQAWIESDFTLDRDALLARADSWQAGSEDDREALDEEEAQRLGGEGTNVRSV